MRPAALGPLVLALLAAGCGGGTSAADELDPRERVRADHRMRELLRDCERSGFYDRDTSSWTAILIEKLEKGKTEPLKRAKEELGALGGEAAAELYRFVDRHYSDAMRSPLVENAIDAASFNLSDEAHQVLLRALRHPQESVRRQALVGFAARHARPEDFEILLERVEGFETTELQRLAVRALFRADPARASRRALEWVAGLQNRSLWTNALPFVAETTDPEAQRRAGELFADLDPFFGVHLAAAAAAGGDEEARAFLAAKLAPEVQQNVRTVAIQAAGKAGLFDLLAPVAKADPSEAARVLALDLIATSPLSADAIAAAIGGSLDDASPTVRGLALKHLVSLGHAEARAQALSMLSADGAPLQSALQALAEPMRAEPELAHLVWERLLERHALEGHRPIQKRTATFKAMGLVPLREAALFLAEVGRTYDAQEIESLRAHEWLMIQASNTGIPGRTALFERLGEEADPLRRLDLIQAIGSARDDLARESLLSLVTDGEPDDLELLFLASRLTRVGPSWKVAPALKRASYEMDDIEARVGLQCLLWHWY